MIEKASFREEIIKYAEEKYGTKPEYLWMRYPDYAVLRHSDNRKWYGIIMNVPLKSIGLDGEGRIDIMNVKLGDALMRDLLLSKRGYLRSYHMGGADWASIMLDGSVPLREICLLLDKSYFETSSAQRKKRLRQPKEWIVPANPKYYDIEHAFDAEDEIRWKQGKGIKTGDTVFIYAAAPVSAILYKCAVTETDIPYAYRDGGLSIAALMKIKLEKRYDRSRFTFAKLGEEYGIYAVRGPRGIPQKLSTALNEKKE